MADFDEFEQELKQALERRPAPPGLKRRIVERRAAGRLRRNWFAVPHAGLWMKAAAVLLMIAILGGWGLEWRTRRIEEQRRGEAARKQVLTALRITGRALDQVQQRLTAQDRGEE